MEEFLNNLQQVAGQAKEAQTETKEKNYISIRDIELKQTCSICPEQYEAFYKGEICGYFRLRHSSFTVHYPDNNGVCIYHSVVNGYGEFEDFEREEELTAALFQVKKKLQEDYKRGIRK